MACGLELAETEQTICTAINDKTDANSDPIRICVVGAAGVGKSTFCNFLCGEADRFQTGTDFHPVTQEALSCTFSYEIHDQNVKFEVTDTPGLFQQRNNRRYESPAQMAQAINECIRVSGSNVSAILLMIPRGPMSIEVEESIHFMVDFFDPNQLSHVWMVFTKSGRNVNVQQILNTLSPSRSNNAGEFGSRANVIYDYSQMINWQCFATECVDSDEKESQTVRHNILSAVFTSHQQNGVLRQEPFQVTLRSLPSVARPVNGPRPGLWVPNSSSGSRRWNTVLPIASLCAIGVVLAFLSYNRLYLQLMETRYELKWQRLHEQKSKATEGNWGVLQVGTSLLWMCVEPVTGTIALIDGVRRVYNAS